MAIKDYRLPQNVDFVQKKQVKSKPKKKYQIVRKDNKLGKLQILSALSINFLQSGQLLLNHKVRILKWRKIEIV